MLSYYASTLPMPSADKAVRRASDVSRYATALLLAVVGHHWLLCFLHGQGITVSVGMVGLAEALIYIACVPLLLNHLSLRALIAVFVMLGASGVLALFRGGYFDPKAARDLLIPLVFLWAGRSFGQRRQPLDSTLLIVMAAVAAIGVAQWLAPDLYNRLFNTFSYYLSLGSISADSAQIQGQTVTLNGLRPQAIGRTILPQLLGTQRIPSVFLEPVSLGNFAVIMMAWGLAKPMREWRIAAWFVAGALLMIVLADSRFGLYMTGFLVVLRLLVHGRAHAVAIIFPAIGACALLAIAAYLPGYGDNMHGRFTVSGLRLLAFDESSLLGLRNFTANFGDMGYAYVISRFSLPAAALMWACVFTLPLSNETARRFRTFMAAYVTLILCISGTSLFALKTAGVLWFVFGVLSKMPAEKQNPIV